MDITVINTFIYAIDVSSKKVVGYFDNNEYERLESHHSEQSCFLTRIRYSVMCADWQQPALIS